MVKVFHLSVDDIKSKIQKLQNQIDSEQVKNNKTKRKRLYHQLAGLKKALQKPEDLVVDPEQQKKKIQQQKHRRIQKKIDKKRQIILSVKKQKRYKKRCLKCGSWQHLLSECQTNKGGGYCYKCGSQDHNHKDCSKQTYDLADCFYCGKKGHIARQCPTNQKGLYRKGGSCFSCGSVRHILKDCPVRNAARVKTGTFQNNQEF